MVKSNLAQVKTGFLELDKFNPIKTNRSLHVARCLKAINRSEALISQDLDNPFFEPRRLLEIDPLDCNRFTFFLEHPLEEKCKILQQKILTLPNHALMDQILRHLPRIELNEHQDIMNQCYTVSLL